MSAEIFKPVSLKNLMVWISMIDKGDCCHGLRRL